MLRDILKTNFFRVDSSSPMAELLDASHPKPTFELISEPQYKFESLINRLPTSEDDVEDTLSDDSSSDEQPTPIVH